MPRIVQKFGGTSVSDREKILAAARKAIRTQQAGNEVVVVVSAMGKTTDMLIDLAKEIHDRPSAREMDMLLSTGEQVSVALMAMAVEALGGSATSLTGGQIGIRTDGAHTKARIRSISTDRIVRLLARNQIVIAAGFQGIDDEYNITTLGRGGSDTTAVALAAVLQADSCEIYTDVDGVYTTDPRLLAEARKVDRISYDEMLELASLGAGVMHSRSVEFGKKFSVPIHVRSSFSDVPGSYIVAEPEDPDRAVCGAALTRNEARVTVANVPDRPGVSYEIFSRVASHRISLDMIVQDVGNDGTASISFTVPQHELALALEAVHEATSTMGPVQMSSDQEVAKVSVVGLGMAHQSGVAARMFTALAREQINIQMISSSPIKISTLVASDQGLPALRAVHREFELHVAPTKMLPSEQHPHRPIPDLDLRDLARRMGGVEMEELFLDGIELDTEQGRVTVRGIPNVPGIAAAVFRALAQQEILVDTVVQSFHPGSNASLSFTLRHQLVERAAEIVRGLSSKMSLGQVESQSRVAKVSVSGIGLRSHTGVAERMFRALAQAGINVNMINTSEVLVTAIIDVTRGPAAIQVLEKAFADVLR